MSTPQFDRTEDDEAREPTSEQRVGGVGSGAGSRRAVAAVVALVDLGVLGLVLGHVHGSLRELAGLAFCLVVPGWAVVGLLRLNDAVLEVGLTLATGLAALVVLAQFVISVNAWHPFGIEVVVCAVCLVPLGWQSVGVRPKRST